jgi:hypothetical protein
MADTRETDGQSIMNSNELELSGNDSSPATKPPRWRSKTSLSLLDSLHCVLS